MSGQDLVEEVARALWEADGLGVNGNAWRWENIDAATKEPSLRRARAAIAVTLEAAIKNAENAECAYVVQAIRSLLPSPPERGGE